MVICYLLSAICHPPSLEVLLTRTRSLDYWLLWVVALTSLAINVWLVSTLLGVRRQAGQAAVLAAQAVGDLRQSSIEYSVHIERALPISLTIPISQTIRVPISTILPIDTQAMIPLKTPIGTFPTLPGSPEWRRRPLPRPSGFPC